MSTHPSAENRIKKINEWMSEIILEYPPIKYNKKMVSRDGLEPSTHSLKGIALPTELTALIHCE